MSTRALPASFSRKARPSHEIWLRSEYDEIRRLRGLTPSEALTISRKRRNRAVEAGIRHREVSGWRLDNPYMELHAWKTMLSCALHEQQKAKAYQQIATMKPARVCA